MGGSTTSCLPKSQNEGHRSAKKRGITKSKKKLKDLSPIDDSSYNNSSDMSSPVNKSKKKGKKNSNFSQTRKLEFTGSTKTKSNLTGKSFGDSSQNSSNQTGKSKGSGDNGPNLWVS